MIEYSAGIVTAYGSAVRAGYTGTYEDFCRQQAQYAENALAVEQAKQTALSASQSADQAKQDAQTASTTAQQSEQSAGQSAQSAGQSAQDAQTAESNAQTYAQSASQSAGSAQQSAQSAQAVLESIPEDYSDLSEDVDKLKADLGDLENDVYTETSGITYTETLLSDICTKLEGYNFSPGTYDGSQSVNGAPNASFDSYTMFATEDMTFYVDTDIAYYAVTIGTGADTSEFTYFPTTNAYIATCESVVRYRKSNGDLPTSVTPITVHAGDVLAFTATCGSTPTIYIQHSVVSKFLTPGRVLAFATSDTVTIAGDSYTVIFSKLTTPQGYQWNITSLAGKDGVNMFPRGVDIVGVIQLYGGSNFMGGAHGNEENIEFRVMANGEEVSNTVSAEEVHVVMNSHLYDPDDTGQNVVDRYVEFVFTSKGWTCRNTFKVLIDTQLQVAYPSGLFAFTATDCDGAFSNVGTVNLSSTTARQLESVDFKEITINLPDKFTLNIRSETADKGWVTYRSNTASFKVYFANSQEATVEAGTCISGCCEYRF